MFVTLLRRPVKRTSNVAISQLLGVTRRNYSGNIPTSGDSGPGKNYRKKLKKETNKHLGLVGGDAKNGAKIQDTAILHQALTRGGKATNELLGVNTDSLLQQLEQLESNHEKAGDATPPRAPTGDLKSPSSAGLTTELKQILLGIKTYTPSEAYQRKRFAMPDKQEPVRLSRPALKGKTSEHRIAIMNPNGGGPRLGIFQLPGAQTRVLPPHKPTLMEEDAARQLASLMAMETKSQFELLMEAPYQDIYPLDNDMFYKTEQGVGFEEHVLLNHLLEGFPKRGPVRHFMELVVTGLSKNPHYTVQEKHDIAGWYKEYFTKFSSEELQAVTQDKPTSSPE